MIRLETHGCEPSFPFTSSRVNDVLKSGRRQCIVSQYMNRSTSGSNRYVVYWVTPKAAHTKIARLLRRPPFRQVNFSNSESRALNEGSIFDVDHECIGTECQPIPKLRAILASQPLEFTFWREPVGHLVSAAAQVTHCLNTYWCISREQTWPLQTASHISRLLRDTMVDRVPSPLIDANASQSTMTLANAQYRSSRQSQTCRPYGRCTYSMPRSTVKGKIVYQHCHSKDRQKGNLTLRRCMRHLYPQSAGYGWSSLGVRRLHFIGRMEHFVDDWRQLLRLLGERETKVLQFGRNAAEQSVVNRRRNDLPRTLANGGPEWLQLASEVGCARSASRADLEGAG